MIADTYYHHSSQGELNTRGLSPLGSAALEYAKQGTPVFPLAPGTKKPFKGSNGLLDATTDENLIRERWSRNTTANIGNPTGEKSGYISLDIDTYKPGAMSIEDIKAKLGPLPETRTIGTGQGGLRIDYRLPEGVHTKCIPEGKLGTGVCVKADGGYVVAPPSKTTGTYEVLKDLPLAEAPEWILKAARYTPEGNSVATKRSRKFSASLGEETIPEGQRDETLTRIAGTLHDASRTLSQLDEELQEINKGRCSPPLGATQVSKIARSIHKRTPCRASRRVTLAVIEALDAIGAETKARECKGLGDHTDYDVMIALERRARKNGRMILGGVRVTVSYRQIAEEASIGSTSTVSKSIKRLKKAGLLRQDGTGCGPKSGALVMMIPPRAGENTKTIASPPTEEREMDSSVRPCAAPSAPRLRWSSPGHAGRLGKIKGRVVDTLENAPDLTLEELASRLKHKRPRDLRRRMLGPLIEAGVVVCVDERYTLASDWREALDRRREEDEEIEAAKRQKADNKRAQDAFRELWAAGEVISKAERRKRERWRILQEDRLTSNTESVPEPIPPVALEWEASSNLSPEGKKAVEAVLAWERVHGPFDFSWSSWKELFYTGPIRGVWPDSEGSDRVAAYLGRLSLA